MGFKKFRGSLCLFHLVLCTMVFNQQSFAGTWTDAFEDDNTQEWEIFNAVDDEKKWWIDDGEAVGETFEPHQDYPTIWATGLLTVEGDLNFKLTMRCSLSSTQTR